MSHSKNLENKDEEVKDSKKNIALILTGVSLIFCSLSFFIAYFSQILFLEIRYYLDTDRDNYEVVSSKEEIPSEAENKKIITPIDENFGVVIPKIEANAKIVQNVDPFNKGEYMAALEFGVAHAKGTALPGSNGNMFLFAHSAVNFYEINNQNVHFYLLDKLTRGDEIYVYYGNEEFIYKVTEKKTVNPSEIDYLAQDLSKKSLTLMTCWPAGTSVKRIVIVAELTTNS